MIVREKKQKNFWNNASSESGTHPLPLSVHVHIVHMQSPAPSDEPEYDEPSQLYWLLGYTLISSN